MPNLLVIQHLKTLYLGGNHVRVVMNIRKSVRLNISGIDGLCYLEYPEKMNTKSEETGEDRPRIL